MRSSRSIASVFSILDQIRVFKVVDKIDIKLSEASSKLTRIVLLAELLVKKFGSGAKDRTDEQLRTMAGVRGKGARNGRRNKSWTVHKIIGARVGAKHRE